MLQRKQPPDPPERGKATLYEAQRRKTLAQAEREELKQRVLLGELVNRTAVEEALFRQHRQIRDQFENVATRIAGLVAAESDQHACFTIIQREITQCLEGLTA